MKRPFDPPVSAHGKGQGKTKMAGSPMRRKRRTKTKRQKMLQVRKKRRTARQWTRMRGSRPPINQQEPPDEVQEAR
jgi:hypothetical protein